MYMAMELCNLQGLSLCVFPRASNTTVAAILDHTRHQLRHLRLEGTATSYEINPTQHRSVERLIESKVRINFDCQCCLSVFFRVKFVCSVVHLCVEYRPEYTHQVYRCPATSQPGLRPPDGLWRKSRLGVKCHLVSI